LKPSGTEARAEQGQPSGTEATRRAARGRKEIQKRPDASATAELQGKKAVAPPSVSRKGSCRAVEAAAAAPQKTNRPQHFVCGEHTIKHK
jgi:hypothetical protein